MLITSLIMFFALPLYSQQWQPDFYIQGDDQTPQMRHALKEVHKLQFQGGESVLDVGCGDGKTTDYIAQKWLPAGMVHGIDISQSMIDKACINQHCSRTSFEQADLFSYTPAKLYDVVVCFWTLYLFKEYDEALHKILSFLKPSGKALICHIIEPGTPFFQLFASKIAPQRMPVTLPSIETILQAIKKTSARIHNIEIKYNYDRYQDIATLVESMSKIPFFSLLPHEKTSDFYTELTNLYKSEIDGSVYDFSLVICMVLEK